jgi:hypothetical protein
VQAAGGEVEGQPERAGEVEVLDGLAGLVEAQALGGLEHVDLEGPGAACIAHWEARLGRAYP